LTTQAPRITGLLDSELSDWRGQVYGLINPLVVIIYTVVQIGTSWYYTKAVNADDNSNTQFVGPFTDQIVASTMMSSAKTRDGF